MVHQEPHSLFDISGRVAVITGGSGLLGMQHALAIAKINGIPVLVDVVSQVAEKRAAEIAEIYGLPAGAWKTDITEPSQVERLLEEILRRYGRVDILINNAANNPKMEEEKNESWSRLENFAVECWEEDLSVGLKGAFLCSKTIGGEMARRRSGVILNVASDLALIAPDQRIYRKSGLREYQQPVKPVTYSVVKSGLLGLTRYLAGYWADKNIRVNAISPGGVFNGQNEEFVSRLTELIPLGRMARVDEYQGAIQFMCSDASSYMTGANLVMDGGRTIL
jgi:NAD(P)-dependent dehydrogenase (short-subunit alcohol dehydrogenase family)